jgi:large subunit ribosomal protein L10
MPKSKEQKDQIVEDLVDKFSRMKGLVFTKFFGLTVNEVEDLRKQCREADVDYVVAKKTLLKVALEKSGVEGINPRDFEGEVATAISYTDEIAPAKTLAAFAKTHKQVEFIGGILEGKLLDGVAVKSLSLLPSKQELLAKVVGSINAPISGFVNVLAGNLRGLVNVLNGIKEKKA